MGIVRKSALRRANRADPADGEADSGADGQGHRRRDQDRRRGGAFRVHQPKGKARDRIGRGGGELPGKTRNEPISPAGILNCPPASIGGRMITAKARARPKLVHNIILSMPAPNPPEKVLAAAQVSAREKFGVGGDEEPHDSGG